MKHRYHVNIDFGELDVTKLPNEEDFYALLNQFGAVKSGYNIVIRSHSNARALCAALRLMGVPNKVRVKRRRKK